MPNLEARVRQLEERAQPEAQPMVIIIRALVGSDPDKLGAAREIRQEPVGLRSMRDERSWLRMPGESVRALIDRVEAELQAEERRVQMLCEQY